MEITKEAVLDFADRMKELAEMKRRYRSETAAELLRQGDALRHHIESIHPDWATEEQLREDFLTHARVSEMLYGGKKNVSR